MKFTISSSLKKLFRLIYYIKFKYYKKTFVLEDMKNVEQDPLLFCIPAGLVTHNNQIPKALQELNSPDVEVLRLNQQASTAKGPPEK
jgi:hypothetical protein